MCDKGKINFPYEKVHREYSLMLFGCFNSKLFFFFLLHRSWLHTY